MNLQNYCSEIASLLKSVDEESWAKSFEFLGSKTELPDKELACEILKIYGGMGSFNDLVLYNDGALCLIENERLEKLRNELYELSVATL